MISVDVRPSPHHHRNLPQHRSPTTTTTTRRSFFLKRNRDEPVASGLEPYNHDDSMITAAAAADEEGRAPQPRRRSSRIQNFWQAGFHKRSNNHNTSSRGGGLAPSFSAAPTATTTTKRRSSWSLRKSFTNSMTNSSGSDDAIESNNNRAAAAQRRRVSWNALLRSAASAAAEDDLVVSAAEFDGESSFQQPQKPKRRSWSLRKSLNERHHSSAAAATTPTAGKSSHLKSVTLQLSPTTPDQLLNGEEEDDDEGMGAAEVRRSVCSTVSSTSVSTTGTSLSELLSAQREQRLRDSWSFPGDNSSFQAAIEEAARSCALEEEGDSDWDDLDDSVVADDGENDETGNKGCPVPPPNAEQTAGPLVKSILKTTSSYTYETSGDTIRSRNNLSDEPIKRIAFNSIPDGYRESGRDMSDEEWERCWFTPTELSQFKKTQADTVKRLFKKKQRNSPLRASFSKRLQNKTLFRQADDSKSVDSSVASGGSKNTVKSGASDAIGYGDWRDCIFEAYQECRKVKRGDMDTLTGHVDREKLKGIYEENEDMVGLEVYILFALRGSVSKQVNRILDYWEDSWQRVHTLGPDGSEKVFIKTCRSLTQPAAILVRELAMAQAAVLADETH